MQIGMIGLGKMGGNMSRRLMKAGHQCVVYARTAKTREALAKDGATAAASIADLVKKLERKATRDLADVACGQGHRRDGRATRRAAGSGRYHHRRRQLLLQGRHPQRQKTGAKGIRYVDCGTSGGVWGIERGYCMMIGGPKQAVDHLDPIFSALAPGTGRYSAHAGPRERRRSPRARLHSCRSVRRRALRQDGAQRHRVRNDAGLCRGLRHPA